MKPFILKTKLLHPHVWCHYTAFNAVTFSGYHLRATLNFYCSPNMTLFKRVRYFKKWKSGNIMSRIWKNNTVC